MSLLYVLIKSLETTGIGNDEVYVCVCVSLLLYGQPKIIYSYEKSLLPSLNVSWLKELGINYVQLDFFQKLKKIEN